MFVSELKQGVDYMISNPGDQHSCRACRQILSRSEGTVTIDHIVPQKAHGTNAITNLQVLCRSCNSKKSALINKLTLKYSGQALARELRSLINY
jgi:5-methylcytosine-specific restriction endonuclease McrA